MGIAIITLCWDVFIFHFLFSIFFEIASNFPISLKIEWQNNLNIIWLV